MMPKALPIWGCVFALALMLHAPAAAQDFTVSLDSPSNCISPHTGSGTLHLDEQKMLHYDLSYDGLTGDEIASHIHGPPPEGSEHRLLIDLPLGTPKVGSTGPLTAGMEADLLAGSWYIIFHSEHCRSGELQGDVVLNQVQTESRSWSAVKARYRGD